MTLLGHCDSEIERRAQTIIATSIEQAEREGVTDWICTEDLDVMWMAVEKRSAAIRQFIAETEPYRRVKDVKCRREWMRVDYDAIEDMARHVAENDSIDGEDLDTYIAYTWEGEGFMWSKCKRTDDRAVAFWRVEWAGHA